MAGWAGGDARLGAEQALPYFSRASTSSTAES